MGSHSAIPIETNSPQVSRPKLRWSWVNFLRGMEESMFEGTGNSLLLGMSWLAGLACAPVAWAQQGPTPGQNVNMVSGTKWPGGDPFLERQNEPSIAVSTRNPLHLLAGANDYRSVDFPISDVLPAEAAGDAWLGVF